MARNVCLVPCFLLAAVPVLLSLTSGAEAWAQEKTDEQMISEWKAHVLNLDNITKHTDGEDITWYGTPYLRGMVMMAEARQDRECLDAFCKAFEYLQSIASRDIDNLYGWPTTHGSYGTQGPRCIIMDDAMITEPVAHFVGVVRSDPELKRVYGERAEKYLEFVEQKIFPKWKDSWLELGEKTATLRPSNGGYRRVEVSFPGPAGVYRFYAAGKSPSYSLPLNQFLRAAMTYLALHDVTGNDDYLEKVKRMATAAKYVYLVPTQDRFVPWCYRQPVWDADFKSPTEPARWVGPHAYRSSYHAGEVGMIAKLHQRGIVFTDDDMRRIVRLHLDVMWNKDLQNPQFGYRYLGRDSEYPASLWSSLAYFDPTIAQMAEPHQTREAIAKVAGRWGGITAVPAYFLRQEKAGR